jgi:hypothetical protein
MTKALRLLLAGVAACSSSSSSAGSGDAATDAASDAPLTCATTTLVIKTPAKRVSQLIGDIDRQTDAATPDQTKTRYSLGGTDLGSSFEYDGKLFFLFGDSNDTAAAPRNARCGDAIAWTSTTSPMPATGPHLDFMAFDGGVPEFRSPVVPGVDLGCFDVPLTGVGDGAPDGTGAQTMYVWFSTHCMSESVLAKSIDMGSSFQLVDVVSDCQCPATAGGPALAYCDAMGHPPKTCPGTCHFVNVSASVIGPAQAAAESLPDTNDEVVLFGSGPYRAGPVYLSTQPVSALATDGSRRFFSGGDVAACSPTWSDKESDAQPIFAVPECAGAGVGELSGHFVSAIGKWVVTYNCNATLYARAAMHVFGPYSAPATLFDSTTEGYCTTQDPSGFIYDPAGPAACARLSDPGRTTVKGGAYGPYLMMRFAQPAPGGAAQVFFTLSTWNPYVAMSMQVEIE